MLAGEKLAVTPAGKPVTDNATADWNPFAAAVDSLIVVDPPRAIVAAVAAVVTVKLGGIETVRLMGCVFVTPPPTADTVRVTEPEAAVEVDESVKVLLPLPGAAIVPGAKLAVTPVGKPLTDSATDD